MPDFINEKPQVGQEWPTCKDFPEKESALAWVLVVKAFMHR